jgi:hypothetical protein
MVGCLHRSSDVFWKCIQRRADPVACEIMSCEIMVRHDRWLERASSQRFESTSHMYEVEEAEITACPSVAISALDSHFPMQRTTFDGPWCISPIVNANLCPSERRGKIPAFPCQ